MTTIEAAERMIAELGALVHRIEPPKATGTGAAATLGALKLSAAHIEHTRAQGGDAATLCAVVQGKLSDLVETLKMFRNSMPAGDLNIAAVNELIARLA